MYKKAKFLVWLYVLWHYISTIISPLYELHVNVNMMDQQNKTKQNNQHYINLTL